MKKLVKKLFAIFSLKVTRVNELHDLGLYKNRFERIKNSENLYLKDFDLVINPQKHRYVLQGIRFMNTLRTRYNARFFFDKEDLLIAAINGINYNIQTFEELFILNEIFNNMVYNFITPKEFAVIDIGMNVGFTSLYLAKNTNCRATYSFEPFKATFEQALFNIALNPEFAGKINAFNYGLGNEKRKIEIDYDVSIKGNMGINGIPDYLVGQALQIVKDEIDIRNAAEILQPIIATIKAQKLDILLKVDCEGSEYEIFDSLNQSQLLRQFNAIAMEWHVNGPDLLISHLKQAGYSIFSFNPADSGAGMIYAVKQ